MRFVYDGEPPQPQKLEIKLDAAFCSGYDLIDESLLVNEKNRGIANVVGQRA